MDDRFLHSLRREPRSDFARSLSERLRQAASKRPNTFNAGAGEVARGLGFTPAWAAVGALALLVTALAVFPSVRAQAQAFLSLFRVRNFATVPIDKSRIEQLKKLGEGPFQLLGEATAKTEGSPQQFATAGEAFASAGWIGRQPSYLPDGILADSAFVTTEKTVDVRLDAKKANETFNTLGLSDVRLPAEFDGAHVGAHLPRAVGVRYRREGRQAVFIQAPNPELSLPAGMDIARLGEIGLRVAGLSADEARRFAANVDWTSTLLVPVPPDASVIREIEVGGHKGLLIETDGRDETPGARANHAGQRSTVLWSDDERVYAMTGNVQAHDLVAMASSVR